MEKGSTSEDREMGKRAISGRGQEGHKWIVVSDQGKIQKRKMKALWSKARKCEKDNLRT